MDIAQSYTLGVSTLRLRLGDIAEATTEVLVSSDDSQLTMGGGTSRSILRAAGDSLYQDTRALVPLEVGMVRPSNSAKLQEQGVKYIFHAATRIASAPRSQSEGERITVAATTRCLELLRSMGLRSIAFPALGTGFTGFKASDVAKAMAPEIIGFLKDSTESHTIELWLQLGSGRDLAALEFFNEFTNAFKLGAAANKTHAVLLIHGIRTRAGWSAQVREELRSAAPQLTPILVGYGFLDALRFLLPLSFWRKKVAETVWRKAQAVISSPNFDRISIVAHSFGSWIATYLLVQKDIAVYRVILCGAVVDADFDWNSVAQKVVGPSFPGEPSRKVLNDIGVHDIWPQMAKSATWGYGNSGRCGFQHPMVEDRYHFCDHSGFFSEGFAAKHWAPALIDKNVAAGTKERHDPGYLWNLLTLIKIPVLVGAVAFLVGLLIWLKP